ncbi:hypothetical protein DPV78_008081 [Talaromyces pinophilus]|nr:hypothetical protein DPV78_008081 [Talaromyces pinophilus]
MGKSLFSMARNYHHLTGLKVTITTISSRIVLEFRSTEASPSNNTRPSHRKLRVELTVFLSTEESDPKTERYDQTQALLSHTLPPQVAYYVSRPTISNGIKAKLYSQNDESSIASRVIALHGLGGTGKSQLVRNYIREYGGVYSDLFWYDSSDQALIEHAYRQHCLTLHPDLAQGAEMDIVISVVKRWFEKNKQTRVLIVFDGADIIADKNKPHYVDINKFIPQSPHLDVIITSRSAEVENLCPLGGISVGRMSLEEATTLFMQCSGLVKIELTSQQRFEVRLIVKTLGYLALAISLAGTYVKKTPRFSQDLGRYIIEYDRRRDELLQRMPRECIDLYKESVLTTWESSFNALGARSQRLLSFLAFIHFDDIALNLLYCPRTAEATAFHWGNIINVDSSVSLSDIEGWFEEILDFSLIEGIQGQGAYAMHPLVHTWSCERLTVSQKQELSFAALRMIRGAMASPDIDLTSRSRLIPHLMTNFDRICKYWSSEIPKALDMLKCLEEACQLPTELGLLNESRRIQEFLLEKRIQIYGSGNPLSLRTKSQLALTLRYLADFERSKLLLEEALLLQKDRLGKGNIDTLHTFFNLSVVLRDLGNYVQAADILREGLEIAEVALGKQSSEVLLAKATLGLLMSYQGMHSEAETMLREEVLVHLYKHQDIRRGLLPIAMNNLGFVLRCRGKFKEAERLLREALRIMRQSQSERHPETLMCRGNLGLVLLCQGKLADAEENIGEVYSARLEMFSERHPDTIMSLNNMAFLRREQGRYEESETLVKSTCLVQEKYLSKQHPEMCITQVNLAMAMLVQDNASLERIQQSEKILRGVVETLPWFWLVPLWRTYLVLALRRQEKASEAQILAQNILCSKTMAQDEDHPHTLLCKRELAGAFRDQGVYDAAEKLYRDAEHRQVRVLGKSHPATLTTKHELARCLRSEGEFEQAEELYREIVRSRVLLLGTDHPDTRSSRRELEAALVKEEINPISPQLLTFLY